MTNSPLRLTRHEPAQGSSTPRERSDAIGAWLNALVAVMRLPERERAEIRDELESHLRERVRDLLIEGINEDEAARRAIAELGEAAPLADRFRHARNTPRRRLLMNIAAVGIAGAALVTSVVALSTEPEKQPAERARQDLAIAFEPALDKPAGAWLGLKVVLDMGNDMTVTDAVGAMARTANLTPRIYWQSLSGEAGIDREFRVQMDKIDSDLAGGLRALFDAIGKEQPGGYNLEYRVNGDVLEIATRNFFDSREAKLVRFDVQNILDNGVDKEEFRELIQTFVEPESWRDNGGDKGSIRIVGGKLFVKAPPRMIEGVEFFVKQLSDRGEQKAAVRGPGNVSTPMLLELMHRSQQVELMPAQPTAPAPADGEGGGGGGGGAQSGEPDHGQMRTFALRYADADAARDLLHAAFNAVPALEQCAVPRIIGTAPGEGVNAVIFQATRGQSDLAAKLVALVDAPAPAKLPPADETMERYPIAHLSADSMRDLLNRAFDASPALKQCAVGRSVSVDANQNMLIVTTTRDQQKAIQRLIQLVDIGEPLAAR